MNDLVQLRLKQKTEAYDNLFQKQGKSVRVENALSDIIQKTQQIKLLSKSIEQCLQLLKIIGILLKEQGGKIDEVQKNIKQGKKYVELAQNRINIAKIEQKKSIKRKCCIIFFGLVAIILILIVLWKLDIVNI